MGEISLMEHNCHNLAAEAGSQPNVSAVRAAGQLIRKLLQATGVVLYHVGLAGVIIRLSPHRVRTLLYHAVEENPGPYTAGLNVNVSPVVFERHLNYYRQHYHVAAVDDIATGRAQPCSLAITFDDGYASVEQQALPMLEQYGMPACIYLIGRAVRGEMVWVNQLNYALNRHPRITSRLLARYPTLASLSGQAVIQCVQRSFPPEAIEQLINHLILEIPALSDHPHVFSTAQDILAMQRRGVTFGFHSQDHYNLALCNDHLLTQQLDRSEFKTLLSSNTFAYPFGFFNQRTTRHLEKQGYLRLLTVESASSHLSHLHMERSEVFHTSAAGVFAQIEVVEPIMALLKRLLKASSNQQITGVDSPGVRDFTEDSGVL